jgi:hypothetical protein
MALARVGIAEAKRPETRQARPEAKAMLDSDRSEQAEDGVFEDVESPCVALVPLVASAEWARPPSQPRSSSIFVTHLIATAEHVPQTRSLRRGTAADAQNAYSAHQHQAPRAGIRTRQII